MARDRQWEDQERGDEERGEFPNEFGIFLNYTCTLCFNDKPNYSYLHKLFQDLFV